MSSDEYDACWQVTDNYHYFPRWYLCLHGISTDFIVLYSVCYQNHIVLRFWYSIAYNFHFV